MNTNVPKRKTKKSKPKNSLTTNSGPSKLNNASRCNDNTVDYAKRLCPLLAKDSEWVDILEESTSNDAKLSSSNNAPAGEEAQLDDAHIKPLTLMFPNLLRDDPKTLEGIVSKALSTTDVARHLVGQKANFSFLRKVDRLIPPDRTWLDRLSENSNSCTSTELTETETLLSASTSGGLKNEKLTYYSSEPIPTQEQKESNGQLTIYKSRSEI